MQGCLDSCRKNRYSFAIYTEGDASKLAAMQQDGVSAILDKPFEVTEVKQLIESSMAFSLPKFLLGKASTYSPAGKRVIIQRLKI